MREIAPDFQAVIAANAAGGGLGWLGRADGRAGRRDRIAAFQRHHDNRRRGDVRHQPSEEGSLAMHIVVLFRQRPADLQQLHADDFQAAALEAFDDLPRQAALHRIRFHDNQCAFQELAFLVSGCVRLRPHLTVAEDKCVCGNR